MANQRLNATLRIGAALDKSVGGAFRGITANVKKLGAEIKTAEKRQRELGKSRAGLVKQGKSVEALDREYKQLGDTLDRLKRKQERLAAVGTSLRGVGSAMRGVGSEAVATSKRVGVAVAALAGAAFAIAKTTADAGDEAGSTAVMLGLTSAGLQELRHAADTLEVPMQLFDASMGQMNKRLGEAVERGGPVADALKQIGLTAEDLAKDAPDVALGKIADAFKKVKNPAERAAIATQVFGKSGMPMINMLLAGSEGINDLRTEAQDLGLVLSEDTIAAGGEFDNAMRNMSAAARGVRNTLGAELIPVFTELALAGKSWMVDHRAEVQEWSRVIGQGIKDAVPVVRDIIAGFGDLVSAIAPVAVAVKNLLGGWNEFATVLGGAIAFGPLAVKLGALGLSVVKLGATFFAMTGPIGWVVLAVGAAVALIIRHWDKIGPALGKAWDYAKAKVAPVLEWFKAAGETLGNAWDGFSTKMQAIVTAVIAAFDRLAARVGAAVEKVKEAAEIAANVGKGIGAAVGLDPEHNARARARIGRGAAAVGEFLTKPRGGKSSAEPQARARGGRFEAGPLRVGEEGEELVYSDRSGYVAHHNALRGLLSQAQGVRRNVDEAVGAGRRGGGRVASGPVSITINQAPGQDPVVLAREIERVLARQQTRALHDEAFA